MKQLQILVIIITAALFFTACEKNESTNLLSITGEVLMQDALTPTITTPLEGINVYLLNAPFTIDSITNWFTKTDILDSVQTNANGFYEFGQLKVGDYVVLPSDTATQYRFKWSENSDPLMISSTNSQKEFTINFITPEPIIENSGGEFKFEFRNYNFAVNYSWFTGDGTMRGKNIEIYRWARTWTIIEWHWWGPEWDWGSWYWHRIYHFGYMEYANSDMRALTWSYFKTSLSKDMSNWLYQYKDNFQIRFCVGGFVMDDVYTPWFTDVKKTITLSGETLKDSNEFEVDWKDDIVVVTRIN